ncbi:MAG: T9SS type A sorting domain-containing protein [Ignavibacteria bacterium]|nr:T9SS type A sorting domain-containing protein [Ignavibacteria bacterium]
MKKLILFFLPVVLIALSLGFYYSNGGNTASSIAEQLNTTSQIPVVNQQFDNVGAWISGSALPSARYYHGGVGHVRNDSGFVYVFGGDSTGAGTAAGVNTYRYNIAANSWSQMASLPQGRRLMGSAKLGDTIYCLDGLNGFGSNMTLYKYNINANTWSTGANAPDSMWYVKAVGYQDSLIYLVGGYGANGVTRTSVFLYNAKTNSWRTATSLPLGRGDGALAMAGDTIVYVGGLNESVAVTAVTYRGVVSQSDRSQITWTTGASYPAGVRYRWNAQSWGNKGVIVSGGASTGFTGSQETYVYSPGANTWTAQTNMPSIMLAYASGSVRYNSGIWKYVIGGGVTSGPALSGNTLVFTDTLSTPPPPASGDSVLVMFHDTTIATGQVKRLADRDSTMKHLSTMISKYRTFYFNATTPNLPSLANYKTVILVETSFDNSGALFLGATARADLKNWLSSGTPADKKALISIGADQAYNYERAATPVAALDTAFARGFCGMIYRVDQGTPAATGGDITGLFPQDLTTRNLLAPTGTGNTGYWPDGASLAPGNGTRTAAYKYNGHTATDTLGGMSVNTPGYFTVTSLQDPRYFEGGAKGWLLALITYAKSNGGTITSTTPLTSTIAEKYSLSQNYPNPFNPTTKINFAIPQNGFVSLKVYDISGKEVMTLVNKNMTVGSYAVDFNGALLSSGVYFYRLETGSFSETKKMMLVK